MGFFYVYLCTKMNTNSVGSVNFLFMLNEGYSKLKKSVGQLNREMFIVLRFALFSSLMH